MKKRSAIELSAEEQEHYLARAPTVILVSIGRDGYPHAVPMWFVVEADGCVYMTTYARSQKVVNVRRNPKVALLVESGLRYEDLKGVLIRGHATVIEDADLCLRLLLRMHADHSSKALPEDAEDVMRAQARKRVVLKVSPERVTSWDHQKLGGVY